MCSGFFKNILLILGIVIFHELGHILLLHHYEYHIESIEIFPFGGITKTDKPINTPIKHEFCIAIAGISFQLILFFFFNILYQKGIIRENTYYLFQNYNKVIFLFNLLPIIPLDGSIIMHSILEYFLPYQKAYKGYLIISIISFCFFTTYHTLKSLNNYMIVTFLLFKIWDSFKKRKYYQNKFYLERYLYEIPYIKIESHNYPDLKKLKKDTLHFFWRKDRYLHEKEFLKEYYKVVAKNK